MNHPDASVVVNVPIPAKEVLHHSDADLNACVLCEILFNDILMGHALKATYSGYAAKSFALNKYMPQSNRTQDFYNANNDGPTLKPKEWQEIRSRHPELKTTDKASMLRLYTQAELDALRGVVQSCTSKEAHELYRSTFGEEAQSVDVNTRGDLYQSIMASLQFGCKGCSSCKLDASMSQYVVADITQQNADASLKDIRVLFLGEAPATEEIKHRIPFIGRSGDILRGALSVLGIPIENTLITNTCFCFHAPGNKPTPTEIYRCFVQVEAVIKALPNLKVIVPIGGTAMSRLGITTSVLDNVGKVARYNKILVYPVPHPSWLLRTGKGVPELVDAMRGLLPILNEDKSVKVPKDRQFSGDAVLSHLSRNQTGMPIPTQDEGPTEASAITPLYSAPVVYQSPQRIYDIQGVRQTVGTGMAVVGVGKPTNSTAPGYIVFRKGNVKQLFYINPMVEYYTSKPGDWASQLNAIEPISNLVPQCVAFDKLRNMQRQHVSNAMACYNSDYNLSTYALTQLKTKYEYVEDESIQPRIWYLDIETEKDAIRVTSESTNVQAKLRLASFFDTYDKAFYVVVVNSNENRGQNISIEPITTTINKNTMEFPVHIERVETDYEAIQWLQKKLIDLDPDLITGWNVESFDMTFLVKRAETLGIILGNKYGKFSFINSKRDKRLLTFVVCDGIAILDYLVLYKYQILKKKETYRLDYITEIELGADKKKDVLEYDHDIMYHQHLNAYVHYNIVDVLRVYELECKLNYITFNVELCRICNIGWSDIFSKIRLIDGIVYQFTLSRGLAATQKIRPVEAAARGLEDDIPLASESDSYEGASVLEPQPGLYEGVVDLDATSLYPTIMIRYNMLCDTYVGSISPEHATAYLYNPSALPETFTFKNPIGQTVETNALALKEYLTDKILIAEGMIYMKPEKRSSIISEILMYLIGQRAHYRKLLRDAKQAQNSYLSDRYEVLQYAYKQLANSIYGVMGTSVYRLSDKTTAAAITGAGRELIRLSAHFASRYIQKIIDEKRLDIPYDVFELSVPSIEALADIAQRKYVIYGDSVVGDTTIVIKRADNTVHRIPINSLFTHVDQMSTDGKEYCFLEDVYALTKVDDDNLDFRKVPYVMRHARGSKRLFDVNITSNWKVVVTEDHSLIWRDTKTNADVCGAPLDTTSDRKLITYTDDQHMLYRLPSSITESTRTDEYVYDIEVEGTHTFFANGILVHNTDSLFINIMPAVEAVYPNVVDKSEKFQKAWEIIGCIGDYINKYIVIELLKRKGIDPEDSMKHHNFNFKQEIVMATSIFFNVKKQYAYRAVMDKGVAVNDRVIKGHEAQKSDTPRAIRGALSDLINYLLDSYDPTQIASSQAGLAAIYNKYYTEYDRLLAEGSVLAARPVSVSQEFEEFTTAQATLKGMLLYSLLYGYEFRAGSKGYLFYIKHINFDAFGTNVMILLDQAKAKYPNYPWLQRMTELDGSVVVIPQETEHLDTNIFTVDRAYMLANFLQKRAEKIFNVVHMSVPGSTQPTMNSLLSWDQTNGSTPRTSSKKTSAKKVSTSIRICM